MRYALTALFVLAFVLGSWTVSGAQFNGAQQHCCSPGLPPTPSPTPQQINLAFAYNCAAKGNGCLQTGSDPGALADSTLYWACETLDQTTASVHSTLITECNTVFAYDDAGGNGCGSVQKQPDQAYFDYANSSNENAFYHKYLSGTTAPSSATRLVLATNQGQCNATATGTAPTPAPQVAMLNPNDATGLSCLYHAFADNTNPCSWSYTGPYFQVANGEGLSEDQLPLNEPNNGVSSAEYGNSLDFLAGTGSFYVGTIWMTAQASIMNGLCGAVCIPIIGKYEGGNGTDYCESDTVISGHCTPASNHLGFAACAEDYRCNVDLWCSALGSNRNAKGWIYEAITRRNLHEAGSVGILVFAINTQTAMMANDSGTACASGLMRFPVQEGTKSNYLEEVGFTWLVPDLNGIPDRFVPWLIVHTNGAGIADANQVAHWPMYDMMPASPEETPAPFVFNGTTVPDSASWCENAAVNSAPQGVAGDSGGVSSLTQFCPKKQEPVMCIQYQHLWIPGGVDKGAVEVCVNTSDTAATIQNSWCDVDPCSTYHHILVFPTCNVTDVCEGAYIPAGLTGPLLSPLSAVNTNCSNTTYCLTSASTAIQFNGTLVIGTTQVPAESAVWMTAQ